MLIFSPQQWELIDPLTGRPRQDPFNNRPVQTQRDQQRFSSSPLPRRPTNQRIRKPPADTLFGQFFQKQIRNERFQPGPPLAPGPPIVNNQHHQTGKNHLTIILPHNL